MIIIGLTGQSGSGKTTFSEFFMKYGYEHINCDLIAREVVKKGEACLDSLVEAFGEEILLAGGELNRQKLASVAFTDERKLLLLNSITHRYINQRITEKLEMLKSENVVGCILDAPTLFEAGADKYCNFTVGILADESIRLQRIQQRDCIEYEDALKRMKAQKEDAFFISRCDYIIYNNQGEQEFIQKIEELYQSINNDRS